MIPNDDGAASFDPQLIAPNEELTIVVDGAQAVSYTHLDVYKRQSMDSAM